MRGWTVKSSLSVFKENNYEFFVLYCLDGIFHRAAILKQAEKLYYMITEGKAWENLADRCCNFSLDEKLCMEFGKESVP